MEPKVSSRVPYPIITKDLPKVRSSAGSSPRSGLQEERREQLLKEFSDLDRDHNNVITFDEIHDFLSEKQGEAFDLTLCKELFSRMDRNHDNEITFEEFVESYIEIEEMIKRQMKKVEKDVKKGQSSLEDNKEKLKRAEQTESLNSAGIMYGSSLSIIVKSAQNLIPSNSSGSADPYVIIECGGKKIETSLVPGSLNPIWDESYTFPITSKDLDVTFTVMSKSMLGDKFVGKLAIPLKTLADQLKREQYFSLSSQKYGEKWQGRICLELQWIWSKTRYYKDINSEWERIIAEDMERLEQLREQLDKLKKPFGYLREPYGRTDITTPASGTFHFEEKLVQKLEEITNGKISIVVENEDYMYYMIIMYMVFAVLINFMRPDFFNVRIM